MNVELLFVDPWILIFNYGMNIVSDLVSKVKLLYNSGGLLEFPVWLCWFNWIRSWRKSKQEGNTIELDKNTSAHTCKSRASY